MMLGEGEPGQLFWWVGRVYLIFKFHFEQQKREEDTKYVHRVKEYFASCSYNYINASYRI